MECSGAGDGSPRTWRMTGHYQAEEQNGKKEEMKWMNGSKKKTTTKE
jgi:hypothetical protein